MQSRYPALEAVLIALSLGSFVFYHVWFFLLKPCTSKTGASKYYGITGKGKLARLIFSQIVSTDPKASILGVQQSRWATQRTCTLLRSHAVHELACLYAAVNSMPCMLR